MIEIAGVTGDRAVMETEAVLRTSVVTLTLLMLVLPAAAQPLRPAVKQAQCPLGYMQTGGFCMPMGRDPPSAIPKRPPVASPPLSLPAPKGHLIPWRSSTRRTWNAWITRVLARGTSLPKMVHLSFSTDPVEV